MGRFLTPIRFVLGMSWEANFRIASTGLAWHKASHQRLDNHYWVRFVGANVLLFVEDENK